MVTYASLPNGGFKRSDGAIIPNDPANNDWQAAIAWSKDNKLVPADVPKLEDIKASKILAITAIANRYLDQIVAGRSAAETLMWMPKAEESQEFLAALSEEGLGIKDMSTRFPMLSAEAKTPSAMESLAREVLGKQSAMKLRSGSIIGIRTRKKAELDAIADIDKAIAYDPAIGWE